MTTETKEIKQFSPTVLVLGPGGAKGFLQVGALLYLETANYLSKIDKYVGVSVGAIITALIVCGLSVKELLIIALETDISADLKNVTLADITEHWGLIPHNYLREKLTTAIRNKLQFLPTMQQLFEITKKSLTIVTYNCQLDKEEYINHLTHPQFPLVEALLASASIPLVFQKFLYQNQLYIDGAFGNPYPVDYHDDGTEQVLGIYIETESIQRDSAPDLSHFLKISQCAIAQLRRFIIKRSTDNCRHLALRTNLRDMTGGTFTTSDKISLVCTGHSTCEEFLKGSLIKD